MALGETNREAPKPTESAAESLKSPEIKRPEETSKEKRARLIAKARTYVRDLNKRGADLSNSVAATAEDSIDPQLISELDEIQSSADMALSTLEEFPEQITQEAQNAETDREVREAAAERDAYRLAYEGLGARSYFDSLSTEDRNGVAQKLVDMGAGLHLLAYNELMPDIDWQSAMQKLTSAEPDIWKQFHSLGYQIDMLPENVGRAFESEQLLASLPGRILDELNDFPNVDRQRLFDAVLRQDPAKLASRLQDFPNVNAEKLGDALLESDPFYLTMHLDQFPNADRVKLGTKMIEQYPATLITILDAFPKADLHALAAKLLEYNPYSLVTHADKLPSEIRDEITRDLVERCPSKLLRSVDLFPKTDMPRLVARLLEMPWPSFTTDFEMFPLNLRKDIGVSIIERGRIKELMQVIELMPNSEPPFSYVLAIKRSPYQAMQRISEQLVSVILADANPGEKLQRIEDVFAKNHLPDLGKRFKVLEILNPPDVVERKLSKFDSSPTLRSLDAKKRQITIYRDFMRSMVDSSNRDLRKYLEAFALYEPIAEKMETRGEGSLTDEEKKQFETFLKRLESIIQSSSLGEDATQETVVAGAYDRLKAELGVKKGQSVGKRLAELYLRPIGLDTMKDALARMDETSARADARNRNLVSESKDGYLRFATGDLIKATYAKWVSTILDTGSNSKECLGSSSDSDETPFDTDLSIILPGQEERAMKLEAGMEGGLAAKKFGDVLFVIKDRGQFVRTDLGETEDLSPKTNRGAERPYELFKTGVLGPDHMGIRTGIASTEISFMILQTEDPRVVRDLKVSIAEKGHYIALADKAGKIIFTPADYDKLRMATLSGLDEFGGPPFEILDSRSRADVEHSNAIDEIRKTKAEARETIARQTVEIRSVIDREFEALGVKWHKDDPDNILGALIHDMGSSGRETDVPGSADFDFIVKLDQKDFLRTKDLHDALMDEWKKLGGEPMAGADQKDLLRVEHVILPGTKDPADIDIVFASKSELDVYESHNAVRDRLNWIKEHRGQDAHDTVVANIVLTKKVFKEAKAYKKGPEVAGKAGQGGLGGIGVENFVLANGGDMVVAFESFRDASKKSDGSRNTLEDFRKNFSIPDAGINAMFGEGHDDFAFPITESGYEKMADAIDAYLTAHVTPKTV